MADMNGWTSQLIGRDRELAALSSFLGEAAVDGATLLLTGEPGVGKTALLVAAAGMATTAGVRVVHGGGVEYETDVSFAGLHQLVDPLSDDLRRMPRSSRVVLEVALGIGSGPAPDRLAVLSASLALFRQAASSEPLLIVVDDLHWLDRASGAVVAFVGRRLRGSPIGLLGAIRPGIGGFREALLVGVLRRILVRETAMWTRLAIDIRIPTVDTVAGAIGRLLEELTDEGRVLSQARRTVFVEATNHAALRSEITDLQDEIGGWMVPLLTELGSSDPSRDVLHLLALMDGLVINQLTSPRPDFEPTRAVTALLNGLSADIPAVSARSARTRR